jgi:hypothetical protein
MFRLHDLRRASVPDPCNERSRKANSRPLPPGSLTVDVALALAECRLGWLDGQRAPELATALLVAGASAPSLCELASMTAPTWREAEPLPERGLREEAIALPGIQEAERVVVVHTLRGVADGSIAPVQGASQLWSNYIRAAAARLLTNLEIPAP